MRSGRASTRWGLLLSVALVATATGALPSPAIAADGFTTRSLKLETDWLRDLGVTDVDGDGHLDIYTVNHSSPENILLGSGDGRFRQAIETLNLTQDPRFPTLVFEGALPPPPPDAAHLVWWWQRSRGAEVLLLRLPAGVRAAGRFRIFSTEAVVTSGTLPATVRETVLAPGVLRTDIAFAGQGSASLAMRFPADIPVTVEFDRPRNVLVGWPRPRPAPDGPFRIHRRDRHAMAWADVLGGPRMELAAVRGGMKGKSSLVPMALHQEMRVLAGETYWEAGARYGLVHGGCSSEAARWIHANADRRLDLFVACNRNQPSRLFIRTADGFVNRAAAMNIDDADLDPIIWRDVDDDGDTDAITVYVGEVRLYENGSGGFTRRVLGTVPARGVRALVPMPLGEQLRFAVVAKTESGMVHLDAGRVPHWRSFASLGVGSELRHVSWVDHDNDGSLELFTMPGGLYEGSSVAGFIPAQAQPPIPTGTLLDAGATWFDANGDGQRDVILAARTDPKHPARPWQTVFALNSVPSDNHWLDIDLRGPVGNASAIGAEVVVTWIGGVARSRVGAFESSWNSQGLHRISLGLGPADGPVEVLVRWPDGTEEVFVRDPDQRVLLAYGTSGN